MSPRPRTKTSPTGGLPPRHLFLLLTSAFLFRLFYGLCSEIWFIDQRQVYLIGLKFFCTGQWPFFGADVAPGIQLPGALQGLVVGVPLMLLPIPEAPYLFLNILSFAGLALFGWYCTKRLPRFPAWIIYGWLLTAPWTLHWSTNIDNDSYTLFASCLFFMGFLETIPALRRGVIGGSLSNAFMGFGFFWSVQFHMSYVLLVPFLLYSAYSQWKAGARGFDGPGGFLAGSFLSGIFLLPTLWVYGLHQGTGGAGNAVTFNPGNIPDLPLILVRFLFLASAEVPRFLGAHTGDRLEFLRQNILLAPLAVLTALLGLLQAVGLAIGWFRQKTHEKDWPAVKKLALGTVLLVYASFLFAIKPPASHTYYLTLPVAMLYGFHVYSSWTGKKWFLALAKLLLVANIFFHAGLAIHDQPVKSLYKDRGTFTKAIAEKNYHGLGERRPDTLY
ncbi:MAG TPA: hypothetical protein VHE12_06045 [bacterium]|nr:hypothetical protein [bacterium]